MKNKTINILLPLLLAASTGLAKLAPQYPDGQQKPNIVVIFMDDMGYGDLASYGATEYRTPHLDRLASEGMRFTHFYAAQAVGSASRAGLLTGCYPNRIGVTGALGPTSKIGLNPSETTIAEMLGSKGYRTAAVGKWHVGHYLPFLPLQQGFDEYLGLPYSNDMVPFYYDGTLNFPKGKARRREYHVINRK